MSVLNWAKVLWTIKYLNELNQKSYFSLEEFCRVHNLNYENINSFLEVSNSIINGDSELIRVIEKEKETLEKLNKLNRSDLSDIRAYT